MTGWRVPLRIARREALRAKGRTILMLVMIALPVLGVTAADVLIQTQDLTSSESLDRRIGTEAAAKVSVWGSRVQPMEQSRDPENGATGSIGDKTIKAPDLAAVLKALGGDRRGIVLLTTDLDVRTERGSVTAGATEVDLRDPLAAGLFRLESGRLPAARDEVVVNESVTDRGLKVGDTAELRVRDSSGEPQTVQRKVVGVVESTSVRTWEQVVGLPGSLQTGSEGNRSWLVSGPAVRWDAVKRVNALGAMVLSRSEILHPSPAALAADDALLFDSGIDEATVTVAILVGVMALIEVVLLAGPAFAVGARRQARPLALLAASGGTPAQARRVVLATGVVIGTVGAALGVVLGIGTARALQPVLQWQSDSWFGPFDVPWLHLVGIAAFGFISALLAAVVPAWIASRQDVVAVLAGRRGDRKPSTRSPFVGLALLAAGAGSAWLGARTVSTTSALFIGVSAILSVLGMLFVVPVVVVAVSRLGRRMPLALRFAVRDAARHRTRTTPAVAAVAATVAGVVALGIGVASQESKDEASYAPSLPHGTASVSADYSGKQAPGWSDYLAAIAREAPDATPHTVVGIPYLVDGQISRSLSFETPGGEQLMPMSYSSISGSDALAYDGTLPWVVGQLDGFPAEQARTVLDAGGVVVFSGDDAAPTSAVVRVTGYDEETGEESEQARRKVPALVVNTGDEPAPGAAIVPVRLAESFGLRAATVGVFIDGATLTEEQESRVSEVLKGMATPGYLYVERGYQASSETVVIQLVLAALGAVLMLGGTLTATFLALSDARPDLATLSAVGATPRMRRGVAAGYALAVGGVGAALGVLVGIVPGIAVTYPLTAQSWSGCMGPGCPTGVADHYLTVPWLLIGGLVVVLPLLVSGVVWLCARSRLPLVARLS